MFLFTMVVVLSFLLSDMNSPTRLEMENMLGKGNYARVISIVIVFIFDVFIIIVAALLHIDNKIAEKERVDRLKRFFSLGNISSSEVEPSQQQHPPGNSGLYPALP